MGTWFALIGPVFGQSKTETDPKTEVTRSLDDLETWLAGNKNGDGWKKFLHLDRLRAQVALADAADSAAVAEALAPLESKTAGLEEPRFARVRAAANVWRRSLPLPTLESLAARAREQKDKYQAIDAPRLARARERLNVATKSLRSYLGAGAAGAAWRKFLKLDALDAQLRPDAKPDSETLVAILDQLQADERGLEQPRFTNLRRRLREYVADSLQAADPNAQTEYAERLDHLAAQLDAYKQEPSTATLKSIGSDLGYLERRGQALTLVDAVKQQLAQPNLLFTAKASFLADGLDRPVNEVEPVRDVILGTSIVGTGRTEGRLTFRFVPDSERALLLAELQGVNYSRSTGYNGPAIIYTTGAAQLKATKLLTIEADGLHGLSTTIDAKLSTKITGIGSTKGGVIGCIVEKVASRRASQQSGQTRVIAQAKANRRLERKFEDQISGELARTNKEFRERFFGPLVRREIYPDLHFSTTTERLHVVGVQGDTEQLGAQSPAPAMVGDPEVAMRMHVSTVNNFAASTLAGETVGQPELEKAALDLMGQVPDRLKPEEGKDDWAITFADEDPITLSIADDIVTLVGRGKKYKSGSSTYSAMNFTVRYKVDRLGKGLKAIRQGDIEILPPGFVPGGTARLSLRQSTLRNLMSKKLEKMFEPEIVQADPIELKGDWKKAGPLAITHLSLAGGWLSVGWNQDRPAANVAQAGKQAPLREVGGGR